VDQPEGIAADAAHVRIDDTERGRGRKRGIDGRAAGAQRIYARLRGERVRARDHATRSSYWSRSYFLNFFLANSVPATSASSFLSATSRSIGAIPQFVQG